MLYLLVWGGSATGTQEAKKSPKPEVADLESVSSQLDSISPSVAPTGSFADFAGDIMSRGDNYLIGGNCALALSNYNALGEMGRNDTAVLLRKAICQETLVDLPAAEATFRNTARLASNHNHQLIAVTGFARILVKQFRYEEAIGILAEQLLRVDQTNMTSESCRSHLLFLFSKALEAKALGEYQPNPVPQSSNESRFNQERDLIEPDAMASADFLPSLESFLAMIDEPETAFSDRVLNEGFTILQRPSESLLTITASISVGLQPVAVLLNQASQQSQLDLKISERAKQAIEGRARLVEIESITLGSYLDELLIPFGLIWQQVDSTIYIVESEELSGEPVLKQFRFNSPSRTFRRFEIEFANSPYRDAAVLARGSIALLSGNLNEAEVLFQQLDQTNPNGEVKAKLFFNQAKLHYRLNRTKQAIQLFYQAIDQTTDPNLEASSYCILSKLHLETSQIPEAVKTGRRGIATAITLEQQQSAAINLARSYILANDPHSANTVLFQNRKVITSAEYKTLAAFLGAYARSVGVSDKERLRIAMNRLLTTLSTIQGEQFDNFADCYIASMAFESLGFREQAIDILRIGLSQRDAGDWHRQALFELAMLQKKAMQTNEAITSFKLLGDEADDWNTKSLIQLAGLYSGTGQTEECLEVCKRLWNYPLSQTEKAAALKALGTAYQASGEHHSAAICFAGMLPD